MCDIIVKRIMEKHHVLREELFPRYTCGESVEISIHTAGYNFAPLLSALFFSPLVFDSSPFQPSLSFSYLLYSSHYLTLPFLFCTMKFSFHTVCHLDMAYELCIFLSPSSRTPLSCSSRAAFTNKVSVSITATKQQSEKI